MFLYKKNLPKSETLAVRLAIKSAMLKIQLIS